MIYKTSKQIDDKLILKLRLLLPAGYFLGAGIILNFLYLFKIILEEIDFNLEIQPLSSYSIIFPLIGLILVLFGLSQLLMPLTIKIQEYQIYIYERRIFLLTAGELLSFGTRDEVITFEGLTKILIGFEQLRGEFGSLIPHWSLKLIDNQGKNTIIFDRLNTKFCGGFMSGNRKSIDFIAEKLAKY
ncbi:MAG: hypothetical protein ACXAC7_01085 [Candidatus Hodarchaeales archaeon]